MPNIPKMEMRWEPSAGDFAGGKHTVILKGDIQ
jgi:hypothetical protein